MLRHFKETWERLAADKSIEVGIGGLLARQTRTFNRMRRESMAPDGDNTLKRQLHFEGESETTAITLTPDELRVIGRALACYRPPEPEMPARITAMLKVNPWPRVDEPREVRTTGE